MCAEYICRNLDFLECVLAHRCPEWLHVNHTRNRYDSKSLCFEKMPPESHCVRAKNMSVWPYGLLPKEGNQGIQHQQMKSTSSGGGPKNVKRGMRPKILWWLVGEARKKLLETKQKGLTQHLQPHEWSLNIVEVIPNPENENKNEKLNLAGIPTPTKCPCKLHKVHERPKGNRES